MSPHLCTAHLVMLVLFIQSVVAHMALLYPMPRGGVQDKLQFDARVHTFIGYTKNRTMPCNGYNEPGPITQLRAGQVINVRFWGPDLPKEYEDVLPPKPTDKHPSQINQARHGGGTCEMSLSYNGGKTFHRIAHYSHSCPDLYYEWAVKIPNDAPSCDELGKCLFVWSWTPVNVPQFYINCADVIIQGVKGGSLPKKGIKIVNALGYSKGITSTGDGDNTMGSGPDPDEVRTNIYGSSKSFLIIEI